MTSLGEIVLKFGATGAPGEKPLRFKAAHINLIVGPNNAGKSLMLREISGVNPRVNRKPRTEWELPQYPPTRIVEAVSWNEVVAQPLRQEIVDENFPAHKELWSEITVRSWDRLVPALDRAAMEIESIRDRLCAALVEQVHAIYFGQVPIRSNDFWSDARQCAPLVVSVALILLCQYYLDESATTGVDPVADVADSQQTVERLTPEQAVAMRQAFDEAGGRLVTVLQSLGIETHGVSVVRLLNPSAYGTAFLSALAENNLLREIILKTSLWKLPKASDAEIERAQHLMVLAHWLLDPGKLKGQADRLRDIYTSRTWLNHGRREQLAKQVLYLDGMARLRVTRSAELKAFDDKGADEPVILALLRNPRARESLRALTVDALDAHLVIDMATRSPKVFWRLAQEEPPEGIETSYTEEAHQFHKAAARLDERSDGIHAFVGMIAAILAKPIDLVFIDEPEAFLHPPLIRKLARQLAFLALEDAKQFFIATHSADLLEAFVSGGAEVNIIRLTHDSERSTARLLNSADLRHLARDPLLRSEATLSALFHEGAVICEAAADRVLYKEINERLLNDGDEYGLDSCAFLNAQNWQTIARMMAPLRKMGVAAAAVVDSDVLFGSELNSILVAAQVDKVIRNGWNQLRNGLRDKLVTRMKADAKDLHLKGDVIAGLTSSEATIFAELRTAMAKYGVFVVPVGELENWLTPLGLQPRLDDKGRWLREALDRLGQDPQSENYVHPAEDDIWEFVRGINTWILDPERKGTSPTPHQDN